MTTAVLTQAMGDAIVCVHYRRFVKAGDMIMARKMESARLVKHVLLRQLSDQDRTSSQGTLSYPGRAARWRARRSSVAGPTGPVAPSGNRTVKMGALVEMSTHCVGLRNGTVSITVARLILWES